jgi:hypothetical protein
VRHADVYSHTLKQLQNDVEEIVAVLVYIYPLLMLYAHVHDFIVRALLKTP